MSQSTPPADDRASRLKFWGTLVILLMMVLMVFSSNIAGQFSRGSHGGAAGSTVGKASDGRVITSADRARAVRLLEQLNAIYIQDPTGAADPVPLGYACWGEPVVRQFKEHPEALALLLQEAAANGPGASVYALGSLDRAQFNADGIGVMNSGMVSTDDLRPIPDSPLGRVLRGRTTYVQIVAPRTQNGHTSAVAPSVLPPVEQEAIYAAMSEFLTIQAASGLLDGAAKVSAALVDRTIAATRQQYALQVATFDAAPRLASTTQPTDAQLQDQLKAYADKTPGDVNTSNPFGFGYRVPDRVKLELLAFKRGDVQRIVEGEKAPYDWEVAARMDVAKDRVAFTSRLPTTHPARVAATQPAATQPAFESFKDDAIKLQIERAVDGRMTEIERRIRSRVTADYQAWSSAQSQKNATTMPASSFGVPYDAPAYLDKLAADVQQQFKVALTVRRHTDVFRDGEQLAALDASFGQAFWNIPPAVAQKLNVQIPFVAGPQYATNFARQLMPAVIAPSAGDAVLDPFEMADTVVDRSADGETILFRITDAQANHPATPEDFNALRDRLVEDWKLAEAQRMTLEAAQQAAKAVDPAQELRIEQTPVYWVTVGPFGTRDAPVAPPVLALDNRSYAQFADGLSEAILNDSSVTPVAAINVPLARKVYVVRRTGLTATWRNESELTQLRSQMRQSLEAMLVNVGASAEGDTQTPAAAWFDPKRIFERNGYEAVAAE